MGGNTFEVSTRRGRYQNAKDAFESLGNDDRYENGHSYSGGIGMKHDFVHIDTVDSLDEAMELSNKLIGDCDPRIDDKWGPAGCITRRWGHSSCAAAVSSPS